MDSFGSSGLDKGGLREALCSRNFVILLTSRRILAGLGLQILLIKHDFHTDQIFRKMEEGFDKQVFLTSLSWGLDGTVVELKIRF